MRSLLAVVCCSLVSCTAKRQLSPGVTWVVTSLTVNGKEYEARFSDTLAFYDGRTCDLNLGRGLCRMVQLTREDADVAEWWQKEDRKEHNEYTYIKAKSALAGRYFVSFRNGNKGKDTIRLVNDSVQIVCVKL